MTIPGIVVYFKAVFSLFMIHPQVAILCITVQDFDTYKKDVDATFQANRGKRTYARECEITGRRHSRRYGFDSERRSDQ